MSASTIIAASRVFTGTEWVNDCAVVIEKGLISKIVPAHSVAARATFYDKAFLVPAFLDLQIYGAAEQLFAVHTTAEALAALAAHNRKGGTAYCLPTLATNELPVFYKGIDAIRDYWKNDGKGVWGLHLEGPWINPVKRGAHIEALIHPPTFKEVQELLEYGKGIIKMITLAPEVCSGEILALIRSYDIIISAGHSNATYEEAQTGFGRGITAVTHLYNAMSPLQHRQPGLVGATLDHDTVMSSIIPDGHHVDYAAVRIAKKMMQERLFVITDAVTGTREGYYPHQLAGDKYESGGILSGSALTMNKAAQNLVLHCGVAPAEAFRMCSAGPAKLMGLDKQLGAIRPGFKAKIAVLNDNFEVVDLVEG